MVRKKPPYPLWRWDRFAYEEGLMAPLDAKGSFIPGYSFSSIHSIKTVTNLHPSFSLNVFHRTLSSPRAQGPFGGQRLEPTAKKSPKHVSNILCCITKAHRPVGWVQLKFGYFSGKARGIKAHYEEVKQIQEELDALDMGGPDMDHELSMVRTWECQHQSITLFSRCP